ncbi:MAG TPA: hypothetical protein VGA00_01875 [Acidiferrobacterales bacterium]
MSQAVHPQQAAGTLLPAGGASAERKDSGLKKIVPAIAAVLALAWTVSTQKLYTPGSDIGYYMGLTGGVMMLILLLYPLRKRIRFLHALGQLKYWFRIHMFLGIAGPLLIVLHSTFHLGSINATVAMVSMLLVAGSGVIGRFIYTKIHHGLYGRRASLEERQTRLGIRGGEVKSKFHFAPEVEDRLKRFESAAFADGAGGLRRAWLFIALPLRARFTAWRAGRELAAAMTAIGAKKGWNRAKLRSRLAYGRQMIRAYLGMVQEVAQFHTYERLFSLWHILHVPFVWLMVFSAVFHVIAVHMY